MSDLLVFNEASTFLGQNMKRVNPPGLPLFPSLDRKPFARKRWNGPSKNDLFPFPYFRSNRWQWPSAVFWFP
jgi:hypothetical protein